MSTTRVTIWDDPDRVVEVLSPIRRQILAGLAEPDSATGLARRLGHSRQNINYHLRSLEDAGLVTLAELRPRRGLTERIMRRTFDVVLVDPTAFDTAGMSRHDVAGLGGVVASALDTIRESAKVAKGASADGQRVAAASLSSDIRLASPAKMHAMLDELASVIARYDAGDQGLLVRVGTTVMPVATA